VLADAGRRISFYFRYATTPDVAVNLLRLLAGNRNVLVDVVSGILSLTPTNQLDLYGQRGTPTLTPNTWYRISLSYTISSRTINEFRLYLNGILIASRSNLPLETAGTNNLELGWLGVKQGPGKICYIDDIYIDDGADLFDPGDVRVTAKLPNGDTVSTFGTAVGNNPPFGSRFTNINERPLNPANGWTSSGAGQSERYILQGIAEGDVDISQFVQLGYTGWINARRTTSGTENMVLNGTVVPESLTNSADIYTQTVSGAGYPSSAAGIGLDASASGVTLYEGGALIAYLFGSQVGVDNHAPVMNAGDDQTIRLPSQATITGSATDDGLPRPPGALTFTWTKLEGPGDVSFANPNAISTTASFSAPGTYVLNLSASDGELTSNGQITITVRQASGSDDN